MCRFISGVMFAIVAHPETKGAVGKKNMPPGITIGDEIELTVEATGPWRFRWDGKTQPIKAKGEGA